MNLSRVPLNTPPGWWSALRVRVSGKKKPRQHKLSGQGENGYSLCATIVRSLERALSEERVTLRARR